MDQLVEMLRDCSVTHGPTVTGRTEKVGGQFFRREEVSMERVETRMYRAVASIVEELLDLAPAGGDTFR